MLAGYSYKCGGLPVKVAFELFDKMVLPIALYGSEVWGYEYSEHIESVQYTFCRRLLGLSSNVSKDVLLGETGRNPLVIHYHHRCVKYWLKILELSPQRFPKACYQMLLNLHNNGRTTWATSVRNMLNMYGFNHVWVQQGVGNVDLFLNVFKLRLVNHYTSNWLRNIHNSSKLSTYSSFKCELVCEQYLKVLDIRKYLVAMSRFRCSNHSLAIERGRYNGTPLEDRICLLCSEEKIFLEDEYHFIISCGTYNDLREQYIQRHITNDVQPYEAFIVLMSSTNVYVIRDVACFLYHAFKRRQLLLSD